MFRTMTFFRRSDEPRRNGVLAACGSSLQAAPIHGAVQALHVCPIRSRASRRRSGSTALPSSPPPGWCSGSSRSRYGVSCPPSAARLRCGTRRWCSSRRRCWQAMPSPISWSVASRPPGSWPFSASSGSASPSRLLPAGFGPWERRPATCLPSSGSSAPWRARLASPSSRPPRSRAWFRPGSRARAAAGHRPTPTSSTRPPTQAPSAPCWPIRCCSSPPSAWRTRLGSGAPSCSGSAPSSSCSGWRPPVTADPQSPLPPPAAPPLRQSRPPCRRCASSRCRRCRARCCLRSRATSPPTSRRCRWSGSCRSRSTSAPSSMPSHGAS